jgi:hypothetical protein
MCQIALREHDQRRAEEGIRIAQLMIKGVLYLQR